MREILSPWVAGEGDFRAEKQQHNGKNLSMRMRACGAGLWYRSSIKIRGMACL